MFGGFSVRGKGGQCANLNTEELRARKGLYYALRVNVCGDNKGVDFNSNTTAL